MNIILNNPYRQLGVYANSSKKDIVANKTKATAFMRVGRAVEYTLDLNGILPPIIRTLEMINEAEAHLAIAKEQIRYAQFWFMKMTPLDEVAFNHLFAGSMKDAKEKWSKQESLSSLQNKLVCELIEKKYWLAIKTAEKLYAKFGDTYINKVDANSTLQMTGIELLHQFIDILGAEVGMQKILGPELGEETKAYISSQTVGPLISMISAEVEKAKKTDRKRPNARKEAGQKLIDATKVPMHQLKGILSVSDPQYSMIADKLGLEILQCGIDYFNNSEDDDAAHTTLIIQNYALSVVVGTLAKQRCEENVKILQEIINQLPPQEVIREDRAIRKELEKYTKLPDKICYAITLLNNTKPHLQSIKQKLGVNNKAYLNLSTLVVNNALHNVIEEVNAAPKKDSSDTLSTCLREAWNAIVIMDGFDLDLNTKRTRYIPNRNTLKELCDNLLPPNGTDNYMRSIDYAIRKFSGEFSGEFSGRNSGNYPYDFLNGSFNLFDGRYSTQKIDKVMTLIRETKQPLLNIKGRTSRDNAFYLKQSTRIASIALNTIIEAVNDAQRDPLLSLNLETGRGEEFKNLMKKSYDAIKMIGNMDVTSDFAQHYRSNRNTIEKICANIGVINNIFVGGEGCAVTLFAILTTAAMGIYCIVTII